MNVYGYTIAHIYTWCTLNKIVHIHAHIFHTYTHMNESHHILGSYNTLSSGWSKSVKTYTHMHMYFTLSRTRTSHVTFWAVTAHFQADGRSQWKRIHTCTCISHVHAHEGVTSRSGQWQHTFERMDQVSENIYRHANVCHTFTNMNESCHILGSRCTFSSVWTKFVKNGFWRGTTSDRYVTWKKYVFHEVKSVLHRLKSVMRRHDGWILTRILTKCFDTDFDAIWTATGTGWRRLIGSPKLQIIFHRRAIKYRSLLRKMTCKDKGSYESSPPCMSRYASCLMWLSHFIKIVKYVIKFVMNFKEPTHRSHPISTREVERAYRIC